MNRRIIYTAVCLAFQLQFLFAQVKVGLTSSIDLTFPKAPEIFDTLGQKVFNFSDENGYYACIINRNAIPGNQPMDLKVYYTNIYKSLQQPIEQCQLIKQTDLQIAGIQAIEFYTTCRVNPDFPEIRYKRLFLYGHDLYILDFWTDKAHQAQADQNKSTFLNSFVVHQSNNEAIIPPALPIHDKKESIRNNLAPILGIVVIGVLLLLLFIFYKKKPKK